jgi:hypothetical protein
VNSGLEKVRSELSRYEHPLFTFDAQASGDAVELLIELREPCESLQAYVYTLQPRDIEHPQFSWSFQRQLCDCLHDYVVEMFTRNPQYRE